MVQKKTKNKKKQKQKEREEEEEEVVRKIQWAIFHTRKLHH